MSLSSVGDEVFYSGLPERHGTNTEYHVVDERIVGRKPASLSHAEAAALPLTALTAWKLLFDRMRVPFSEQDEDGKGAVLIVNGAGGVGSMAV